MSSSSFCLVIIVAAWLVMCWRCVDATIGSCGNAERYMRSEAISIMKTIKRHGQGPSLTDVSACLGGFLLVDLSTARYLQYSTNTWNRRHKRALFVNFTAQPQHKWNTMIPYYFNFTGVATGELMRALQYVEHETCIRFGATTDFTVPYLSMVLGQSCTTFMGRSTDTIDTPFIMTRMCANTFGDLIRLLANVLGMLAENLRPDRGSFIYINSSNIDSTNLRDLQPVPGFVSASVYDYASITHAHSKQYAAGAGYTILPSDPLYLKVIGQQVEWSFLDAKAVNSFYCSGVCSYALSCQRGGYVDPNNCAQCRCPDGFAGTTCQSLARQTDARCGAQQELIATSSDQYITSPGYSTRYGLYTNCTWRISAPSSSLKIQLKFIDSFGLYEDAYASSCCHWVEIRYQGSINATGPRFCGRQTPLNSLVTDDREVLVLFRSNFNADSVENVGFKLLYRLVTCDPAWSTTVRLNTNSIGGQLQSQPFSEAGCRDYCAYDVDGCVAAEIDHNTRPYPGCWIHRNAANLDRVYVTYGITQFRLNMTFPVCRRPPAATTSSGVCIPWRRLNSINSVGAVKLDSATTLDVCQAACVANPLCVAVEWDTRVGASFGCWVHTNRNNLVLQYYSPTVTQYQLTRCTTTRGTTRTTSTTTTTSTSTTTTTTTTRPTTTSSVCTHRWIVRVGVNSADGHPDFSLTTLIQCQAACIDNPLCLAVDWNTLAYLYGYAACWIHTDANSLQRRYATYGVTQYELANRCIPPAPPTTVATSDCQPTWLIRNNTQSAGGTLIVEPIPAADCLNRCAVTATCVAVDLVTSCSPPQCWMHYHPHNLQYRYHGPNITQYELLTRCITIVPPVSGCGGVGVMPGQPCQPCVRPVSPPRTCSQRRWQTYYGRYGWRTRLVTVYTSCTRMTCSSGAVLTVLQGVHSCVWVGWSSWSSCSLPCRGLQQRSYWSLAGHHYRISQTQRQSCNNYWWC